MIPELGTFAIILALLFSFYQMIAPLLFKKNAPLLSSTAVLGQTLFLGFAMLSLIGSFLLNDITVIYVREHSHALLPFIYRVGAAWGGHEGSLLLWCFILSGWSLLFVRFKDPALSSRYFSIILSVLGLVSFSFILFLLITSNPFLRDFPQTLIVGNDLTPILQDPGLIFHPPMLYLGYVGFAIPFAFAIAALIERNFQPEWARACRPWIIMPWSFLSCGIVLGSWWAYRELGWGGWWFWDPVENASLLPWLSGTALLHSLIVSEKRDTFTGWTLLLAIITFGLSLIGTFLVRSGVLISVHAFANDPARGLFLLFDLSLVMGGAFLLYAIQLRHFYRAPTFKWLSRETLLLINSVILLTTVATVLLGTLYPIILDALNLGKISVGEPYFNTVFVPIMLPLLFLMGIAPHVKWGHDTSQPIFKKLRLVLLISLLLGFSLPHFFGFPFHFLTSLGLFLGIWIILATLQTLFQKKLSFSLLAMVFAHLGIAVTAMGICLNKSYSEELQIKLKRSESVSLASYTFTLKNITQLKGPNYQSTAAFFEITQKNHTPISLIAEQRTYTSHNETLSKPGVVYNPWRDLYLALGNPFSKNEWSVRIYYKPFVRWIWAGGFMLLFGGLCSLLNYLIKRRNK